MIEQMIEFTGAGSVLFLAHVSGIGRESHHGFIKWQFWLAGRLQLANDQTNSTKTVTVKSGG